ncbi:calcium-binding protein [Jannaschia formosa]|uniref:calcium-binding protein n=1 Tax=Jannaschia formosa TaxID=2259592 RepID=UPI000E1BF2DB|nr:calcium-binding protein [Jannaschia formosa]TFL18613.1 calcium-binding protein [Jannaschia formosa]
MTATAKPWHHFVNAFAEALAKDDREAFRAALQTALSGEDVTLDYENRLLIDGNEAGRAYNAMGQSDMGLYLILAGAQWDVPKWIDGGMAAFRVMLTDHEAGGLGLLDLEAETAWFAGLTSRSADTIGGTLNKHLYAARQILLAADVLEEVGRPDAAALYQRAGEAGLRKMVLGEHGPRLADFFVHDQAGEPVLNAWAYYRVDDADPSRPAYVRRDVLNAEYHGFDMKLIHQVAALVGPEFDWAPFHATQVDGLTAFGAMLEVVLNKLDSGGMEVGTPVPLGQFTRSPDGDEDLPSPEAMAWFESFLPAPDIEGTGAAERLRGTSGADSIVAMGGGDRIDGGAGDDRVRGGDGDDRIAGGDGADRLNGGQGDDTLIGSAGDDVLIGGPGADAFAFVATGGVDRVLDFGAGDRLALDDRFLGGAGTTRPRPLDPFVFAIGEATPETRVLYDPRTGLLSVDFDGAGPDAPRAVAILSGAPTLDASDLLLF